MGKISLEGLRFKAYHGYYDEERAKGNQFEVDITVTTNFTLAATSDDLAGTVDYERLYAIVAEEMTRTAKLLEHVVGAITNRVLDELSAVESVEVRLAKFDPPIGGVCKRAVVSLQKNR